MTEAKYYVSGRDANGTLFGVRGDTVEEFADNLRKIIGETGADSVRALFYSLIPDSNPAPAAQPAQPAAPQQPAYQPPAPPQGGWGAAPLPQQALQGAREAVQAPPQAAPLCSMHQAPAKWVPGGVSKASGKPYNAFWACAVGQKGDGCKVG